MRIFKQGNWEGSTRLCPICNSGKDGEVVLIPIDDKVEGYNAEAVQVHLECISLFYNEKKGFIYQIIRRKQDE